MRMGAIPDVGEHTEAVLAEFAGAADGTGRTP
jgi:hypothetical protein